MDSPLLSGAVRFDRVYLFLVIIFFLAFAGILFLSVHSAQEEISGTVDRHRSYFLDADFFNRAYENNSQIVANGEVVAGIIPHHLLASHLIAEFFQGIERSEIQTIVVIGPDHEHRSFYNSTISEAEWWTPFGILEPDTPAITELIRSGVVSVDEKVFAIEHSITGEVAFVKKSFPNAKIVPIVVKNTVSSEESKQLAQALVNTLSEKSFVIASVDFAHDISHQQAVERNAINVDILSALDIKRVSQLYVDSVPSIETLLWYVKKLEATDSQLLHSSDTFEVIDDYAVPSGTSYITMYFTK